MNWPPPDKEVVVLNGYFPLILHKKIPKYASISGFFMICLNKKYLNSKLLCILKDLILDEVQGKKANKPRGLFAFLTQKFAKSELFRTKLPYLVVANYVSYFVIIVPIPLSVNISRSMQ